jgi:hypothetical protein
MAECAIQSKAGGLAIVALAQQHCGGDYIDRLRIHFRTRAQPAMKTVALAALDFSCASPVAGIDIDQHAGGDVLPKLKPYTRADNLALIRSTWSQTGMLKLTPAAEMERVAALPDQSRCEHSQ